MDAGGPLAARAPAMTRLDVMLAALNGLVLVISVFLLWPVFAGPGPFNSGGDESRADADIGSFEQHLKSLKAPPRALERIALFNPSRQYPADIMPAAQIAQAPLEQASRPVPRVKGVVLSTPGESLALVFNEGDGRETWLRLGESHQGWTLDALTETTATWSRAETQSRVSVGGSKN